MMPLGSPWVKEVRGGWLHLLRHRGGPAGRAPSSIVWADDAVVAFMDLRRLDVLAICELLPASMDHLATCP
jgi:hypothetical protein